MDQISGILHTFSPVTLKELDSFALLDRIDTKYIFRIEQLPVLLEKIRPYYHVLEVNHFRINKYETLYFDTENFYLYLQHHNGNLNRYKIRYRCYKESNISYFEIKFKNNRNRTIKERLNSESIENEIKDEASEFLINKTAMNPSDFSAKLWVYYSRITLVNKVTKERLTIDTGLNFKNNTTSLSYPALVIAELKQEKACISPFKTLMKENHINTENISKYCFGVVSVFDHIKKNNFKFKLLTINKLCHD